MSNNLRFTEQEPEAWQLLFALSAQGGFQNTRLLQAIARLQSDSEELHRYLKEAVRRIQSKTWHFAYQQLDLALQQGVDLISIASPRYPQALKQIADPPLLLFARGGNLSEHCIAVVGARRASESGLAMAFELGSFLANRGRCVVSGLALGVDACAHRGAISACRPGTGRDSQPSKSTTPTVAVLGSGVDCIQPRQNTAVAERILEVGGVILSEFGVDTGAQRYYFPRRNRIIAGLSQRTIVVEAAHKSGSLITARYALESGRDVSVVPGPPLSKAYQGSNRLLSQGAELLLSPDDLQLVLEPGAESFLQNRLEAARNRLLQLSLPEQQQMLACEILELLEEQLEPLGFDELCGRMSKSADELRILLALMELEGIVHQNRARYHLGLAIDRE